jgi:hypothetical protein
MIGSISAALFVAKLLDSEDGSSTPLALALGLAMAVFAPMGGAHASFEKAKTEVVKAGARIASQAPSFPAKQ